MKLPSRNELKRVIYRMKNVRSASQFCTLMLAIALSTTNAHASDISCASTHQPAERIICDHAILNNEYEDIANQQQSLLSTGRLSPGQLSRWQQARNACGDVHCIDTVFAQWTTLAKSIEVSTTAAGAADFASASALAPVGPNPDAVIAPSSEVAGAADASGASGASVVQRGSAAGVALPQPVASQASAPVVSPAVSASSAGESRGTTGMRAGLIAAIFVAIGCGALVNRRRKSVRPDKKP